MKEIFVFGGGGTAKDVISFLKKKYDSVTLVVPEEELKEISKWHEAVLSDKEMIRLIEVSTSIEAVIAISNPYIKIKVIEKLKRFRNKMKFPNVYMSNLFFEGNYSIGIGNIIYPNVGISMAVKIGNWCVINSNVWIPHDVLIEDFVTIEMNAAIGGNIRIMKGVTIGAGAALLPGITIGEFSTVGIGSVVIRDVPSYVTTFGNPSKIIFLKKKQEYK